MTRIYVTKSFEKSARKIKVSPLIVAPEIEKHSKGAKNLIKLMRPLPGMQILKAYLSSGKLRTAILLQVKESAYIPLFVVKKNSPQGENISKYSRKFLFSQMGKVLDQIEKGQYKTYNLPHK